MDQTYKINQTLEAHFEKYIETKLGAGAITSFFNACLQDFLGGVPKSKAAQCGKWYDSAFIEKFCDAETDTVYYYCDCMTNFDELCLS